MTPTNLPAERLKRFFWKRKEIVLAFLFGSGARRQQRDDSDVDIAVLFRPNASKNSFKILWRELESTLRRSIDLIRLDIAAPSVAWEALRGIPLLVRDRDLLMSLILKISREAEDDQDFLLSLWRWREKIRQEKENTDISPPKG